MPIRTRPAGAKLTMWRLGLVCGHTAFALCGEPHAEGLVRLCHSCDAYVKIVSVEPQILRKRRQARKKPDVPSQTAI